MGLAGSWYVCHLVAPSRGFALCGLSACARVGPQRLVPEGPTPERPRRIPALADNPQTDSDGCHVLCSCVLLCGDMDFMTTMENVLFLSRYVIDRRTAARAKPAPQSSRAACSPCRPAKPCRPPPRRGPIPRQQRATGALANNKRPLKYKERQRRATGALAKNKRPLKYEARQRLATRALAKTKRPLE
jgi:hypothetical protein